MPIQSEGADRAPLIPLSEREYREYVVQRDKERPLSFSGIQLAKAIQSPGGSQALIPIGDTIKAVVYKTRGGKFITSLAKTRELNPLASIAENFYGKEMEEGARPHTSGYRKAAVHETLEDAMAWFRPGRLTDEIRKQLGFDEPIRIE